VPKSYLKFLGEEDSPTLKRRESQETREAEADQVEIELDEDSYDSEDSSSYSDSDSKDIEENDDVVESLTHQEITEKFAKKRRSSFEIANEAEAHRSQQVRHQKLLKNMESAMTTRHGGVVSNVTAPPGYIVSYLGHEQSSKRMLLYR
jgi:hypothetical protein